MFYTVCKTLRLSVFNKELFDFDLIESLAVNNYDY